MQLALIIALFALINWGAYAQNFPSGSDNVEINLDALKPMKETYEPPAMFGAPLTTPEVQDEITQSKTPARPHIDYFDPPPIPPKRPHTFHVSKDYIRSLTQKAQKQEKPAPPSAKPVNNTTTITEPIEGKIIDNDINADVVHMDVQNVLNSIGGNDLTESIAIEEPEKLPPTIQPTNKNYGTPDSTQSIEFEIGSVELSEGNENFLRNNIVPALKYNAKIRLEIRAYASPNLEEKNSRRTSLTRALNLRKFLELHGVSKNRVTIRALGDKTDKSPADRADLMFLPL